MPPDVVGQILRKIVLAERTRGKFGGNEMRNMAHHRRYLSDVSMIPPQIHRYDDIQVCQQQILIPPCCLDTLNAFLQSDSSGGTDYRSQESDENAMETSW
eukprot:gnl/Carplike_NY0171/4116_a5567_328.p1 GENE.gnl/Carplike_NY0171/4116_a5567_328~~gnl/Carplike_NY0171/4116_a5567_328.p1  ORF type:complete len:100 (-),score=18.71 gnl/Carplike_NY0171/4116_a5567_328:81-380(-)